MGYGHVMAVTYGLHGVSTTYCMSLCISKF